MQKAKEIHVRKVDDKWGVVFQEPRTAGGERSGQFIGMNSKVDAVRYAYACEQRTGSKVVLTKE